MPPKTKRARSKGGKAAAKKGEKMALEVDEYPPFPRFEEPVPPLKAIRIVATLEAAYKEVFEMRKEDLDRREDTTRIILDAADHEKPMYRTRKIENDGRVASLQRPSDIPLADLEQRYDALLRLLCNVLATQLDREKEDRRAMRVLKIEVNTLMTWVKRFVTELSPTSTETPYTLFGAFNGGMVMPSDGTNTPIGAPMGMR